MKKEEQVKILKSDLQQAVDGKFSPDAVFKGQTSFDLQLTQQVTIDGKSYGKVKYKLDSKGENY
ncbi:MAG: hypothetical protein IJ432_06605, partial [Clostridia bacterium]|nr:hypothetical protein [Clostridia bacterium]